jgi:hypothetical protein
MKRVLLALALAIGAVAGGLSAPATANATAILVAECDLHAACWNGPDVPWSYNLSGAQLASLGLGTSQPLMDVQTDCCVIRLSGLQITFQTPGGPVQQTAPDFNGNGVIGEVDLVTTYFIPADATSAVISGIFGNSISDSSAAQKIYFGALVPEPGTWAMMIVGLAGLGGLARARRGKVFAG